MSLIKLRKIVSNSSKILKDNGSKIKCNNTEINNMCGWLSVAERLKTKKIDSDIDACKLYKKIRGKNPTGEFKNIAYISPNDSGLICKNYKNLCIVCYSADVKKIHITFDYTFYKKPTKDRIIMIYHDMVHYKSILDDNVDLKNLKINKNLIPNSSRGITLFDIILIIAIIGLIGFIVVLILVGLFLTAALIYLGICTAALWFKKRFWYLGPIAFLF